MIRLIMHGCNGKMGQVISNIVAQDPEAELVAGIDKQDDGHNPYPVFSDICECNVEADA
ncbi:MAG: 4-hydroxy-tetrahydrodipicolinate reductase, partial [Acetatifactor sp.]|nr:4-hydroxy-tetrahydrodipicolinate reductase [Acetatifactor sp.]